MVSNKIISSSKLRSVYLVHRLNAAKTIVSKLLSDFPGHSIGTIYPETISRASFDIHKTSGLVARVHVKFWGKPEIHVVKGNEVLGKVISSAFQREAKYKGKPKIKSLKKLPVLRVLSLQKRKK